MDQLLTIFIDFDGTISRQDVSNAMLARFCRGDWKKFDRLWEQGELTTADCAAQVLAMMDASPEELTAFFQEQEIDPAFPDFSGWAGKRGLPIYVLSDGFDNYIRIIMDKFGLAFRFYANHLVFRERWQGEYPYASQECQQCGVCKKELISLLRDKESRTVYIGDGYSDACPAPECDLVFAKDQLAVILEERGHPFYHFCNFADIQQKLESLFPALASGRKEK